MSSKYEELVEEHYPVDKLIEMYVKFYGEDYREQIQRKLKKQKLVFATSNITAYKVKEAFKAVYGNSAKKDWQKEAQRCVENLEALANDSDSFDCAILAEHAAVLKTLGFDVSKILLVHKQKQTFKLNGKSEETERLREFADDSSNVEKDVKSELILNNFVSLYNQAAQRKMVHGASKRDTNGKSMLINMNGDVKLDCLDSDLEFPEIQLSNLSKKEEQFLTRILSSTCPIKLYEEDEARYFLKNINKIFNKSFKTMEDFLNDKTMQIFSAVKDIYSKELNSFIISKQAEKFGLIEKSEDAKKQWEAQGMFDENVSCIAFHYDAGNIVGVSLDRDVSHRTIAHEANHALSKSSAKLGDFESTGFDEIVNEFLTQKALENSGEHFERDSGYQGGIDLLKPFLNKFINELKISRMKGVDVLKKFIGEANYKILMDYGNLIAKCRYGQVNVSISVNGEIATDSVLAWMNYYKKDPSIMDYVIDSHRKGLEAFIQYEKFVENLVAHYAEFAKGNIVNIPLEQVVQNNKENELTLNMDQN